jgi:hypothetical protein
MDLKWFLRYLTLTRWSRLLAVALACVFFGIVAIYFLFLQSEYRQKEWHFKNISFITHSVTLESGRIYKISWEQPQKTFLRAIEVNGIKAHTMNYAQMRYISFIYSDYCSQYFNNPFYVRVNEDTDVGLLFEVRTPVMNIGDGFFSSWVESFGDPLNKADWNVIDVTDTDKNASLTIDGSFPIYKIRK